MSSVNAAERKGKQTKKVGGEGGGRIERANCINFMDNVNFMNNENCWVI